MLAEKIKSVRTALGTLSHQVPPEVWEKIKLAREELEDAYEMAMTMELSLMVPNGGQDEAVSILRK